MRVIVAEDVMITREGIVRLLADAGVDLYRGGTLPERIGHLLRDHLVGGHLDGLR